MKINTDGVLLGALAEANESQNILDIGTGTGVIALMLAQRFPSAKIDAVEIDQAAAQTAEMNFKNSPFTQRLTVFPLDFKDLFNQYPAKKYDLIVSNPPFHLNSLESPKAKKTLAKHVGEDFFADLIKDVAAHLTGNGLCWLVLALQAAGLVKTLAMEKKLQLQKIITIHSFENSEPHREILCFGFKEIITINEKLVIYDEPKHYSEAYRYTLKNFFTIF